MSTFAICRCCNLVQQQIQILQWKSRFSNGCVIHVKESVVFLVLSANVPALWAPVRKPVLFWPSWCGCSNGTTNPKKQYHYNVMHCWCWMITRSSPSHDYILRFFFFLSSYNFLFFSQPCMTRPRGCPRHCETSTNQTGMECRTSLSLQKYVHEAFVWALAWKVAESLCFLFSFSFQQDGYVFVWPYNANLLVIRHFRIDPAATFVFFLDHVSK